MNTTNTNNNDNYNMIIITYFTPTHPYHLLLSLLQKNDNACILHIKIQIITACSLVAKFLLMTPLQIYR